MPRSYGGLWEQITSWENIVAAYVNARRGKSARPDALRFHCNLETNLYEIRERLLDGSWEPRPYNSFEKVTETKRRLIQAPTFGDRVVHHAVVRVLEPLFERKFIYDSYACRKGKGTHAAADRVEYFARLAKARWGKVFVLKCDVSKFFPSIDHSVLMEILARTIRETRVLGLIEKASIVPGNLTGKGLPIGSLTSQLLANVYLNDLDHFAKECAGCRFYARYADDFLFLDNDKRALTSVRDDVEWLLGTHLSLRLNPKTAIFPLSQGIDFCGYRIWPTHRLPRKRVVQAAKRRFERLAAMRDNGLAGYQAIRAAAASFFGYMKHCSGKKSADSVIERLKPKLAPAAEKGVSACS